MSFFHDTNPFHRLIKLTVKPRLIVIRHVSLFTGYAPNSNSFSPPRINTQSRVNGSGPFNSHASSPLHSSVHKSPYSPSYLSSSFTQRDLVNGASPYHPLGGASSGITSTAME
uniref:Uncharacterized protein n=1 Tax=Magallana gigas TaxID=29159 RepID=K1P7S9_MAGGI